MNTKEIIFISTLITQSILIIIREIRGIQKWKKYMIVNFELWKDYISHNGNTPQVKKILLSKINNKIKELKRRKK